MSEQWFWNNLETLEPGLYDQTDEAAFFTEMARRCGGPVLDLGCGAGRLAIPMCRAGAEVVGLDVSIAALRSFREKLHAEPRQVRGRVTLVCADMRRFALRREFRLVICSSNTLLLLSSEDAIRHALECVSTHMSSEGRLVVDVAALDEQSRAAFSTYPAGEVSDIESRTHRVRVSGEEHLGPRTLSITYRYSDSSRALCGERTEELLLLTPVELLGLLESRGFEAVERYGWYDRRPFAETGRKLLVVARRRETSTPCQK
ncbi:MAG: class I SAM-dependent methyltransferase [Candidatus Abyssubacteria bacterium]